MDSYEQIFRFPSTEQGRWLRGLLKNAGHRSFLVSGPWTHEGRSPGQFSDPLQTFSLYLVADGSPLCVQSAALHRRIGSQADLEVELPLPVAQRIAKDLSPKQVLSSVRNALEAPVTPPPPM